MLVNIETIYAVLEPDQGGATLLAKLAKSSLFSRIHCIDLGSHKNVSGLYLHCPDTFSAAWEKAKQEAKPLPGVLQERAKVQADEDEKCVANLRPAPGFWRRSPLASWTVASSVSLKT